MARCRAPAPPSGLLVADDLLTHRWTARPRGPAPSALRRCPDFPGPVEDPLRRSGRRQRLDRFPAQAVVVFTDDGLAVLCYAFHTGVCVRAELARLVAVAGAGFGIAAGRWRWRRRSDLRSRRRGRLARREPHPGGALLAVRRHPDSHRDPDSGRGAADREPERMRAGRVGAGRLLTVTSLEMRDDGNPRARRGDDRDAHLAAGTRMPPGHRRGAGERGRRR